ncbi:MAG: hypothetical protein QXF12_00660 [Candidatus Aenigmatarchaeota archaeon]
MINASIYDLINRTKHRLHKYLKNTGGGVSTSGNSYEDGQFIKITADLGFINSIRKRPKKYYIVLSGQISNSLRISSQKEELEISYPAQELEYVDFNRQFFNKNVSWNGDKQFFAYTSAASEPDYMSDSSDFVNIMDLHLKTIINDGFILDKQFLSNLNKGRKDIEFNSMRLLVPKRVSYLNRQSFFPTFNFTLMNTYSSINTIINSNGINFMLYSETRMPNDVLLHTLIAKGQNEPTMKGTVGAYLKISPSLSNDIQAILQVLFNNLTNSGFSYYHTGLFSPSIFSISHSNPRLFRIYDNWNTWNSNFNASIFDTVFFNFGHGYFSNINNNFLYFTNEEDIFASIKHCINSACSSEDSVEHLTRSDTTHFKFTYLYNLAHSLRPDNLRYYKVYLLGYPFQKEADLLVLPKTHNRNTSSLNQGLSHTANINVNSVALNYMFNFSILILSYKYAFITDPTNYNNNFKQNHGVLGLMNYFVPLPNAYIPQSYLRGYNLNTRPSATIGLSDRIYGENSTFEHLPVYILNNRMKNSNITYHTPSFSRVNILPQLFTPYRRFIIKDFVSNTNISNYFRDFYNVNIDTETLRGNVNMISKDMILNNTSSFTTHVSGTYGQQSGYNKVVYTPLSNTLKNTSFTYFNNVKWHSGNVGNIRNWVRFTGYHDYWFFMPPPPPPYLTMNNNIDTRWTRFDRVLVDTLTPFNTYYNNNQSSNTSITRFLNQYMYLVDNYINPYDHLDIDNNRILTYKYTYKQGVDSYVPVFQYTRSDPVSNSSYINVLAYGYDPIGNRFPRLFLHIQPFSPPGITHLGYDHLYDGIHYIRNFNAKKYYDQNMILDDKDDNNANDLINFSNNSEVSKLIDTFNYLESISRRSVFTAATLEILNMNNKITGIFKEINLHNESDKTDNLYNVVNMYLTYDRIGAGIHNFINVNRTGGIMSPSHHNSDIRYAYLSGVNLELYNSGMRSINLSVTKDMDFPLYDLIHSVFTPPSEGNMKRFSLLSYSFYSNTISYFNLIYTYNTSQVNNSSTLSSDNIYLYASQSNNFYPDDATNTDYVCTHPYFEPYSYVLKMNKEFFDFYIPNHYKIAFDQNRSHKNHQYFAYFSPRIFPRAWMGYYAPTVARPNPEYVPFDLIRYKKYRFKVRKRKYIYSQSYSDFIDVIELDPFVALHSKNPENVYVTKFKSHIGKFVSYIVYYVDNTLFGKKIKCDIFIRSSYNEIEAYNHDIKSERKNISEIIKSYYKETNTTSYSFYNNVVLFSSLKFSFFANSDIYPDPNLKAFYDMISFSNTFLNNVMNLEIDDFIHPVEPGIKLGAAVYRNLNVLMFDNYSMPVEMNENWDSQMNNIVKKYSRKYSVSFVPLLLNNSYVRFNALRNVVEKDSISISIRYRKNRSKNFNKTAGWGEGFYIKYSNQNTLNRVIGFSGKVNQSLEYEIKKQRTYLPDIINSNSDRGILGGVKILSSDSSWNFLGHTFHRYTDSRAQFAIYTDKTRVNSDYVKIDKNVRLVDRPIFFFRKHTGITGRMSGISSIDNLNINNTYHSAPDNNVGSFNPSIVSKMQFYVMDDAINTDKKNILLRAIDRTQEPIVITNNIQNPKTVIFLFANNRNKKGSNPYAGLYALNKSMLIQGTGYNFNNVSVFYPNNVINNSMNDLDYYISNQYFSEISSNLRENWRNITLHNFTGDVLPRSVVNPFNAFSVYTFDYYLRSHSLYNYYPPNLKTVFSKTMFPRLNMYINKRFFTDEARGFIIKKVSSIRYEPKAETYNFNIGNLRLNNMEDSVLSFVNFDSVKNYENEYNINIFFNNINMAGFKSFVYNSDFYSIFLNLDNASIPIRRYINDFDIQSVSYASRSYGRVPFLSKNQYILDDYLMYYIKSGSIPNTSLSPENVLTPHNIKYGGSLLHVQLPDNLHKHSFINNNIDDSYDTVYSNSFNRINRLSNSYNLSDNSVSIPDGGLVEIGNIKVLSLYSNYVPPVPSFYNKNLSSEDINEHVKIINRSNQEIDILFTDNYLFFGSPPSKVPIGASNFIQGYYITNYYNPLILEMFSNMTGSNNDNINILMPMTYMYAHVYPPEIIRTQKRIVGSNIFFDLPGFNSVIQYSTYRNNASVSSELFANNTFAGSNIVYQGFNKYHVFSPIVNNNIYVFMPYRGLIRRGMKSIYNLFSSFMFFKYHLSFITNNFPVMGSGYNENVNTIINNMESTDIKDAFNDNTTSVAFEHLKKMYRDAGLIDVDKYICGGAIFTYSDSDIVKVKKGLVYRYRSKNTLNNIEWLSMAFTNMLNYSDNGYLLPTDFVNTYYSINNEQRKRKEIFYSSRIIASYVGLIDSPHDSFYVNYTTNDDFINQRISTYMSALKNIIDFFFGFDIMNDLSYKMGSPGLLIGPRVSYHLSMAAFSLNNLSINMNSMNVEELLSHFGFYSNTDLFEQINSIYFNFYMLFNTSRLLLSFADYDEKMNVDMINCYPSNNISNIDNQIDINNYEDYIGNINYSYFNYNFSEDNFVSSLYSLMFITRNYASIKNDRILNSVSVLKNLFYFGSPFYGKSIIQNLSDLYFIYNDVKEEYYNFWEEDVTSIELPMGTNGRVSAGITFLGADATWGYYKGSEGGVTGRNYSSMWDKFYGEYVLPPFMRYGMNPNDNRSYDIIMGNSYAFASFWGLDGLPPIRTGYNHPKQGNETQWLNDTILLSNRITSQTSMAGFYQNAPGFDYRTTEIISYTKMFPEYYSKFLDMREELKKYKTFAEIRSTTQNEYTGIRNLIRESNNNFRYIMRPYNVRSTYVNSIDTQVYEQNNPLTTKNMSFINFFAFNYDKTNRSILNDYLISLTDCCFSSIPTPITYHMYYDFVRLNKTDINKYNMLNTNLYSLMFSSNIYTSSYNNQNTIAKLDSLEFVKKYSYKVIDNVVLQYHTPDVYGILNLFNATLTEQHVKNPNYVLGYNIPDSITTIDNNFIESYTNNFIKERNVRNNLVGDSAIDFLSVSDSFLNSQLPLNYDEFHADTGDFKILPHVKFHPTKAPHRNNPDNVKQYPAPYYFFMNKSFMNNMFVDPRTITYKQVYSFYDIDLYSQYGDFLNVTKPYLVFPFSEFCYFTFYINNSVVQTYIYPYIISQYRFSGKYLYSYNKYRLISNDLGRTGPVFNEGIYSSDSEDFIFNGINYRTYGYLSYNTIEDYSTSERNRCFMHYTSIFKTVTSSNYDLGTLYHRNDLPESKHGVNNTSSGFMPITMWALSIHKMTPFTPSSSISQFNLNDLNILSNYARLENTLQISAALNYLFSEEVFLKSFNLKTKSDDYRSLLPMVLDFHSSYLQPVMYMYRYRDNVLIAQKNILNDIIKISISPRVTQYKSFINYYIFRNAETMMPRNYDMRFITAGNTRSVSPYMGQFNSSNYNVFNFSGPLTPSQIFYIRNNTYKEEMYYFYIYRFLQPIDISYMLESNTSMDNYQMMLENKFTNTFLNTTVNYPRYSNFSMAYMPYKMWYFPRNYQRDYVFLHHDYYNNYITIQPDNNTIEPVIIFKNFLPRRVLQSIRINPSLYGSNHPGLGIVSFYYFMYPNQYLTRIYSIVNGIDFHKTGAGMSFPHKGKIINHGGFPYYESHIFDYIYTTCFVHKIKTDRDYFIDNNANNNNAQEQSEFNIILDNVSSVFRQENEKELYYVFPCPHPNFIITGDDDFYTLDTQNSVYMPELVYSAPPLSKLVEFVYSYLNQNNQRVNRLITNGNTNHPHLNLERTTLFTCFPQVTFPCSVYPENEFDYHEQWNYITSNGGIYAMFADPEIELPTNTQQQVLLDLVD